MRVHRRRLGRPASIPPPTKDELCERGARGGREARAVWWLVDGLCLKISSLRQVRQADLDPALGRDTLRLTVLEKCSLSFNEGYEKTWYVTRSSFLIVGGLRWVQMPGGVWATRPLLGA